MSFAVTNNCFHDLGALLIRKDEFHFEFFAQQQLYWGVTGHAADGDFDAATVDASLLAIALDCDPQAEIQRISLPTPLSRPVLLGPC